MKKKLIAIIMSVFIIATVCQTVSAASGGWQNDGYGWWYLNDDGTYPVSSWLYDGNSWYHFDNAGYMQTGWIWDGGNWYYMNPSGSMYTGWLQQGTDWYYLNPSGSMATGTVVIDGVNNQFDGSGRWLGQSGGGSGDYGYSEAYYRLLNGISSDISMLRNLADSGHSWMTNVVVADVVGDSTPELFYFTVNDEYGEFTPPWMRFFTYTHVAYGHLVTYDSSTGNITELLDPGYLLYFNDYGETGGYFDTIRRIRFYTVGNNCIYRRASANILGTAAVWSEYSYTYAGAPMYESYTVTSTAGEWPEISNPVIAGLIDGSVSGNLIVDFNGNTDYWSMSYEDALNYFY